jgi:hypothetical protein
MHVCMYSDSFTTHILAVPLSRCHIPMLAIVGRLLELAALCGTQGNCNKAYLLDGRRMKVLARPKRFVIGKDHSSRTNMA